MKALVISMVVLVALSMSVSADFFDFYDECNTGTGLSSNPYEEHCPAISQGKDCCAWYQDWHVHDMGQLLTADGISLSTYFMNGNSATCTDHGVVYVSENIDGPWTFVGNMPEVPQGYTTVMETFNNIDTDFRYVKIASTGICNVDWSSAGAYVPEPQVPEFGLIAGTVALAGAIAGFIILRKK